MKLAFTFHFLLLTFVAGLIPYVLSFKYHIPKVEKYEHVYNNNIRQQQQQQQQQRFAFQRLNEEGKSQFPLAIVTAGLKESSLEIVDGILAEFFLSEYLPPVIVLGISDLDNTLYNILLSDKSNNIVMKRDHEMPSILFKTQVPVILFSGFENAKLFNIISRYKSVVINAPSLHLPECAFANVVSPALHKPFKQLIAEITADHIENK